MREAMYWEKSDAAVRCLLCPCHCVIREGNTGLCLARRNAGGSLISESWGQVTALALDPIEKKPLRRFFPGSMILSVGSYGCNLRCPFCQNHSISMKRADSRDVSPGELAAFAAEAALRGNIGVAYTYNEPLVGYEYVLDCARLVRAQGQKNILVTNGAVCAEPLNELLPLIDAMNIDLKCFSEESYLRLGVRLQAVKDTIRVAAALCHVEVTTLIVPGFSDNKREIEALAAWIASVDEGIPLHVSQYTPRYRYTEPAVNVTDVHGLADIARRYLRYVYTGNC